MSKYVIDSSTLVSIADAIRTKDGSTGAIQVSDFPARISAIEGGGTGGGVDVKAILEDADKVANLNYGGVLDKYYTGNSITLNLSNKGFNPGNDMGNILRESTVAEDMTINIDCSNFNTGNSACSYFLAKSDLKKLNFHISGFSPKGYYVRGLTYFCNNCAKLEEVNDDMLDFIDDMDGSMTDIPTIFSTCYNLKNLPANLHKLMLNTTSPSASWAFQYLFRLKEIEAPICLTTNPTKFVVRNSSFQYLYSLKHLKFTNPYNIVYTGVATTSSTYITLDLSYYIGYCNTTQTYLNYMTDVVNGTLPRVTDDATYQQYKNGDYYTTDINYSHYDKVSALETIASLPDVSGITNASPIIKFKGASGAKTDGGAINTMTDDEIAVAVAKGWTVQFA